MLLQPSGLPLLCTSRVLGGGTLGSSPRWQDSLCILCKGAICEEITLVRSYGCPLPGECPCHGATGFSSLLHVVLLLTTLLNSTASLTDVLVIRTDGKCEFESPQLNKALWLKASWECGVLCFITKTVMLPDNTVPLLWATYNVTIHKWFHFKFKSYA